MGWKMYRWVWQVEAPLHLGMPPAGMLNRTRLYVPAWVLWGALTAELTRRGAGEAPSRERYEEQGKKLAEYTRFTYLFPAQKKGEDWAAWLPQYKRGKGLVWLREDDTREKPDREFRRWLLSTRTGTAIDPSSDSALEGSLREHEVVHPWSRWGENSPQPVFLVGYLFEKGNGAGAREVEELFLGGETRYGLGKVRRVKLSLKGEGSKGEAFSTEVLLDRPDPEVHSELLLAHLPADGSREMTGALEQIAGWYGGKLSSMCLAWTPGSKAGKSHWWKIGKNGLWLP